MQTKIKNKTMIFFSNMHHYLLPAWLGIGSMILIWPALKNRNCEQATCSAAGLILTACAYVTLLNDDFSLLAHCVGIFTLIGWIVMRKFGTFDSGFAAKKFLTYHLAGILLFFLAKPQSHPSVALFLIALCFFSGSQPFHGWIEHFFSHAPSGLVLTFLLFFRPIVWFFTLQFICAVISIENYEIFRKFCLIFGLWGSLFVPVLFFSKRENRKFLGYMVCWQNGILWLILSRCKVYDYVFLFEFSIMQGILLALLFLSFIATQRQLHGEDVIGLRPSHLLKKSRACFIFMLLIPFGIWPLLVSRALGLSCLYLTYSAISCSIYFSFLYRTFLKNRIGI